MRTKPEPGPGRGRVRSGRQRPHGGRHPDLHAQAPAGPTPQGVPPDRGQAAQSDILHCRYWTHFLAIQNEYCADGVSMGFLVTHVHRV